MSLQQDDIRREIKRLHTLLDSKQAEYQIFGTHSFICQLTSLYFQMKREEYARKIAKA